MLEPLGLSWLVGEYGFLGPYFNILPIITMVLFVWQAKQFQQPAANEEQEMMQNVSTFMMVFMGFLFFKVSSGLCLYFIASSIWGIAEKWYVTAAPKEPQSTEPTEEQLADTAKEIQAKKDRRKRAKDLK
jgi:YidC/Oxa1 family membrane protein insertase